MLEFNLTSEKLILFSPKASQVKTMVDAFVAELMKVRAKTVGLGERGLREERGTQIGLCQDKEIGRPSYRAGFTLCGK